MRCPCSTDFVVDLGRVDRASYRRAKSLLTQGDHPTFVGPEMVARKAHNGGLWFYLFDGRDVAVSIINPRLSVLLVLNVHPTHRGHELGQAIIGLIRPTWIRSVSTATPWFERLGYIRVGEPKRGRSLVTDLLVRGELIPLAGRLRRVFCPEKSEVAPEAPEGMWLRSGQEVPVGSGKPDTRTRADTVDDHHLADQAAAGELIPSAAEKA